MIKKYLSTILTVFIFSNFICLTCCNNATTSSPSTTIVGSDNLVTENRSLANFSSVDLRSVGIVNLTYGAAQDVSVTVNDNILEYIETTVSNGVLTVDIEPGHRFSNLKLTVDITMMDLELITNTGAGTIKSMNSFEVESVQLTLTGAGQIRLELNADQLISSHTGAGYIVLQGEVATHQISHSGAGSIHAFDLMTDTTVISLSGAGKAEVYVAQLLEVTITGAGSVYYIGYPTIVSNITGVGNLIDAN